MYYITGEAENIISKIGALYYNYFATDSKTIEAINLKGYMEQIEWYINDRNLDGGIDVIYKYYQNHENKIDSETALNVCLESLETLSTILIMTNTAIQLVYYQNKQLEKEATKFHNLIYISKELFDLFKELTREIFSNPYYPEE